MKHYDIEKQEEIEVTSMTYDGDVVNLHWHEDKLVFAKPLNAMLSINHEYVKNVSYAIVKPDGEIITGVQPATPVNHTNTTTYSINLGYSDDLTLNAISRDSSFELDDNGVGKTETTYTVTNPNRDIQDIISNNQEYTFTGTKSTEDCTYWITIKHGTADRHILSAIKDEDIITKPENAGSDGASYELVYGAKYYVFGLKDGYSAMQHGVYTVAGDCTLTINHSGTSGGVTSTYTVNVIFDSSTCKSYTISGTDKDGTYSRDESFKVSSSWTCVCTPINSSYKETTYKGSSAKTITAKCEPVGSSNTYTVTFIDNRATPTTVKTQTVNHGESATPPSDSKYRAEYAPNKFAGWSGDYTNVTSNRTVYAKWYKESDGQSIWTTGYAIGSNLTVYLSKINAHIYRLTKITYNGTSETFNVTINSATADSYDVKVSSLNIPTNQTVDLFITYTALTTTILSS